MRPSWNSIVVTDALVVLDMTRVLLVRHGQSVANCEKFFAGSLDSPLTALGVSQAELTAQYIANNYQVDGVYSSDLQRAYITAKALADRIGQQVIALQDLREINGGQWQGRKFEILPQMFPQSYGLWLSDIGNAACDGGESVAQMQSRVMNALHRIVLDNPGKTVVIATHGTPIRSIQCACEGKSLAQMKDVKWVSNASVSQLIFEDNRFRIEQISYDAHLGQLTSVLPANC